MYSVVDVETTGLSPRTDRLVEIAVVDLDAHGRVLDEYVTLVNPGQDVGPTHIHGLRPADVAHAPPFVEVAPHLLTRMAGRVIVGHNVDFDWRFLAAEYDRLGVRLPDAPRLCTMALADEHLDRPAARTLVACCQALGVPLDGHHSALGDARATAGLLAAYRRSGRRSDDWWRQHSGAGLVWPWMHSADEEPSVTRSHAQTARRDARTTAHPLLNNLVTHLPPRGAATANVGTYLTVLDTVLEDRRVSDTEAGQLRELARELGLARPQMLDLHTRYLGALAATAWADGMVTEAERADLDLVARLLGLTNHDVEAALTAATTSGMAPLPTAAVATSHPPRWRASGPVRASVPLSVPPATASPPRGWYPDPWSAAPLRWWDGTAWTPHIHSGWGP